MRKRTTSSVAKTTVLCLSMLIITVYATDGEERLDRSLEAVLTEPNVSVVMYLIPFDVLTRMPVSEDMIRSNYSARIIVRQEAIERIRDLVLTPQPGGETRINARLLIDVVLEDQVVHSLTISPNDIPHQIIVSAFHDLLGLYP